MPEPSRRERPKKSSPICATGADGGPDPVGVDVRGVTTRFGSSAVRPSSTVFASLFPAVKSQRKWLASCTTNAACGAEVHATVTGPLSTAAFEMEVAVESYTMRTLSRSVSAVNVTVATSPPGYAPPAPGKSESSKSGALPRSDLGYENTIA